MESAFGGWLRNEIDRLDMTYQEFGKSVGSTHSSVSQWVAGTYPPEPRTLRRIAEITNADAIDLFRMVGYLPENLSTESVTKGIADGKINPKVFKILNDIKDWPDVALDFLEAQIRLVLRPRLAALGSDEVEEREREETPE